MAKNTDSSNYEAFIKVVTGYDNAWREGYSTEGNTVGYTVVDRQLFKTQLTSLYDGNEAAIDALTVHSEDLVTPIEPEPSPTYADIPTVTSAYASEQAVTVNWSAAANAVSYDVYLEQDGSVRKSRTGCSGLSVTFYGVEYGTYNAYVIANPAKDRNQISNTFAVEVVAPDKVVVESGYCGGEGDGENLKWELDSEGTLTIRGEGKMKDYSYNDYVPWRDCNIINRVKKVLISNGVTSLEDWAFCGCSELSSITIPDSVTSIGDYTFEACTNLKSVAIPESVASIGIKTFGDCTKLTNIIIPDSVISIGSFAFSWCENLSSITISNNVTSIDEFTFYECKNLDNITIPTSVTYIDAVAFGGCDKLRDVYYSGSEAEWAKITIEDYNESLTSVTIHFNSTPQPEKKPTVTAAGTTQEVKVGTNGKMTVTVPNVVNNKAATVTFDQAAVEKISGYGDLTLTVRDNTANLSSNLKNAVEVKGKNAASIVITLTSADGTPVFTEGTSAGKAVVTIPYKAGLLSKNIKVFYVNGDKLTSQEFTYNQLTGVVTLTLEHFSEYLITSESEAVPTPTPAVTTQRRRYTAATATAAADTKVNSASTFDAGVGIYAVSAILSVTGMAWAGRKKH